jgi:hypothetical protein
MPEMCPQDFLVGRRRLRELSDLDGLADRINAEHTAGEAAVRRGLQHFRKAGDLLLGWGQSRSAERR